MIRLYFIIVLVICISCSKDDRSILEFSSFTKKINLGHNNILLREPLLIKYGQLEVINNYLVIFNIYATDKLFHLYETNKYRYITSFGKLGNGPKEITQTGFFSVDKEKEIVWGTDVGRKRFVPFPLDSLVNNYAYYPINFIEFPHDENFMLYNFSPLSDEQFIVQSFSNDFSLFNIVKEKKNIKSIGENYIDKSIIPFEYPNLYNFTFSKHPVQEIYACGYRNFDVLKIVNNKGKVLREIKGPDNLKIGNDRYGAYRSIKCTQKFIYCQYTGGSHFIENENGNMEVNYSNIINIFSWEGQPIAQLELDVDILSFTIDKINDRIIAFIAEEEPLVFFNFNEKMFLEE